jgi:hypothetical protein
MAARKLSIMVVLVLTVSVGLTAARVGLAPAGAATGDSVVLAWNQQVLDTIQQTTLAPTIAARALAVVHTAIYDAWAAYDPVAVPTIANGNGRRPLAERTLDNKNKAVSFAAYAALVDLFPARQTIYEAHFELKVTIPAGSSKVEPRTATQPGVPAQPITLSWTNFQYAANQAGLSRQYGGVHFEHGDKDARAAGAKVGDNAWAKAVTYFNGTAVPITTTTTTTTEPPTTAAAPTTTATPTTTTTTTTTTG